MLRKGKSTEFFLCRNCPDPFKKKTMIQYCVSRRENIKIEVLDSEKIKVKTLVNEIKDSGTYQVEFIAKRIKEGIYIYSMRAGKFKMARRMLYLK